MKIRSTMGLRVLLSGVAGSALMWGAAHAQEAPATPQTVGVSLARNF